MVHLLELGRVHAHVAEVGGEAQLEGDVVAPDAAENLGESPGSSVLKLITFTSFSCRRLNSRICRAMAEALRPARWTSWSSFCAAGTPAILAIGLISQ